MFVTFEGGEGTGKTTLIKLVEQKLKAEYNVISTREPGGSFVAEAIRDIILNPMYNNVTPYTEALLLAASRAQHLDEVVIPALNNKQIVLCDRYLDSSLAYQGYARKLGFDFILSINRYAVDYMPNITFYIDLDPVIGIQRISFRKKNDRLDQESISFHSEVRTGYLELAKKYPERIVVLDGTKTVDELVNLIVEEIKSKL